MSKNTISSPAGNLPVHIHGAASTDSVTPTGPITPRDIEIAVGLRTTIGRLVKVLRRETRNDAMLSITERSTLGLIDQHPGMLPTELAAMEKVTTQSISQVINQLSALGYVNKNPSPDDGRKVLLTISPSGKEYIERLRRDKQEWMARILHERTTEEEKGTLEVAIRILSKLIEE